MDPILHWVSTYGYFAIFSLLVLGILGLPVPDEWLLVFSGYLVYSGRLNLAGTLTAAALGAIGGISCSYALGRCVGLPLIHSRLGRILHISDAQVQRVHDWFHRIGHWSLFFGYFVPGVRHFTALVAGTSALEFRAFAAYAYSGAIFWVCLFIFVGVNVGEHWQTVVGAVDHNLKLASLILGGAVLLYLLWRFRKRKPSL